MRSTTRWTVWATCAAAIGLAGLAGCGGPADHSDTTLKRLEGLSIQTAPPQGRLLKEASDRGSNSSITGKQPALQRVFSTPSNVRDTTAYYQSNFPTYHLAQLPGPGGSQVLTGGLGLDSVVVTISPSAPQLHPRPPMSVTPDGSSTYVVVFSISGGG